MVNDFLITDINLEGFQVVHGGYFQKQQASQMTLWKNAVQFNAKTFQTLSNCECIKMLVNKKARQILIQPCPSKDPDAISWMKDAEDPRTRKLACEPLARQIFDGWGWDTNYHYRTNGMLVRSEDRLMMLFDFKAPEIWNGMKMVKK